MKAKTLKGILAICMVACMCISVCPSALAAGKISIVNVFNQGGHSTAENIQITAQMPAETVSGAKLILGTTELVTSTQPSLLYGEGYYTVTGQSPASPVLGINKLTLRAEMGGEAVTAESTIVLKKLTAATPLRNTTFENFEIGGSVTLGDYIQNYYSLITASVKEDKGNKKVYFENNPAGPMTEESSRLSFYARTGPNPSWARYGQFVEFSCDALASEVGNSLMLRVDSYPAEAIYFIADNGTSFYQNLPLFGENSKLGGSDIDVTYGKEYHFTLRINLPDKKFDLFADNEKVCGGTIDFNASSTEKTVFAFTMRAGSPNYVTVDNLVINTMTYYPEAGALSYTSGGNTITANNSMVSIGAESLVIPWNKDANKISDVAGNVTLRTKAGTAVTAAATVDADNKIVVTPAGRLADDTEYEIVIGKNVKYDGSTIGVESIVPFTTYADFECLAPMDNAAAFIGESFAAVVTAPAGTQLRFVLDGVEKASVTSENGYVSANISTEGISAGNKTLEIFAHMPNGTYETIRRIVNLTTYLKNGYFFRNFDSYVANSDNGGQKWQSSPDGISRNMYFEPMIEGKSNGVSYVLNKNTRTTELVQGASGLAADKALPNIISPNTGQSAFKYPFGSPGIQGWWLYSGNGNAAGKLKQKGNMTVMEFDFKLLDNNDYDMYVGLAKGDYGNYLQFLSDKKIIGSDRTLNVGDWVHIKAVIDFTQGTSGTYTLYADGNYVTSKAARPYADDIDGYDYTRIFFDKKTPWDAADEGKEISVFAIDNLDVYTLTPMPVEETMEYTASGSTTEATQVIPTGAESISITFNGDFVAETVTSENVTLSVDGVQAEAAVAYDAAARKITLTPTAAGALLQYKNAKIILGTGVKVQSQAAAVQIALSAPFEIPFLIGDADKCYFNKEISTDGTDCTAKYILVNEGNADKNATIVFASYAPDGKRLVDVEYESASLKAGASISRIKTVTVPDGGSAKAMLWDENLIPYID